MIGAVNVLWFDGASFAISCLILLAAVPRPAVSLAESAADSGGVLAGARFVVSNPLLARVTVASPLFGFSFPLLLATLPVLTEDRYHGHAAVAGLLFAAWGGGALLGTLIATRLASRIDPIRLGAFAAACMAIPLWFLVMTLPAWPVAAILVVSGIFTPMLNAPLITLGYALAGPLLGWTSIDRVFLISAAGISLAALALFTLLGVDTDAGSVAEPVAAEAAPS